MACDDSAFHFFSPNRGRVGGTRGTRETNRDESPSVLPVLGFGLLFPRKLLVVPTAQRAGARKHAPPPPSDGNSDPHRRPECRKRISFGNGTDYRSVPSRQFRTDYICSCSTYQHMYSTRPAASSFVRLFLAMSLFARTATLPYSVFFPWQQRGVVSSHELRPTNPPSQELLAATYIHTYIHTRCVVC